MSKEKPEVGDIWSDGTNVWLVVSEASDREVNFRYLKHSSVGKTSNPYTSVSTGIRDWPNYFYYICTIHKDIDWGRIADLVRTK